MVWTDSYILSRNLKWSTTKTYNIGLDVDVLRRKLGLELDVFYQVTSDLLEGIGGTFPSSLGGNNPSKRKLRRHREQRYRYQRSKHQLRVTKDFNYSIPWHIQFSPATKILKMKDQ